MDILEKLNKIIIENDDKKVKEIIKEAALEIKKLRNNKDLDNQFMKRFMTKN